MKKHFILLAGVAQIAALQMPQTAFAQAAPADDAQASSGGGLDEIVVTANKREENLNDVGLTITAIGADAIAKSRITSLEDVVAAVPGLVYSPSTANTPIFTLRGIGFNEAALAVYPAVSVYTDQVPLPFPVLAGLGFVAVFAGAANTPIASTIMAMELFGSEIGIYAGIACVVSYLFSGHTGIYRAQRIGQVKHASTLPEGLRLADVAEFRKTEDQGTKRAPDRNDKS